MNSHSKDVEIGEASPATPVGYPIATAVITESSQVRPPSEDPQKLPTPGCCERGPHKPLVICSILYSILILILLLTPRWVASTSAVGFDAIAYALLIVIFVGGPALLLAIVTTIITVIQWSRLALRYRAVGLYPMLFSVALFIVLYVISKATSEEIASDPCIGADGSDCPPY